METESEEQKEKWRESEPESRGHRQFSDEDARCGAPRRRGGAGGVFEETEAENIPDLWKDMSPGSSVDSNKINSKRPTSRLTIIRLSEAKDLKSSKQGMNHHIQCSE